MKTQTLPALGGIVPAPQPASNTPPLDALEIEFLAAWDRCRITQRLAVKTRYQEQRVVLRLRAHAGKTLWHLTTTDYVNFITWLIVEHGIVRGTQRSYQNAIRQCTKFLSESHEIQSHVQQAHGARFAQLIVGEAAIVHVHDIEREIPRLYLDHEQFESVFTTLERQIGLAEPGSEERRMLQRDKAFYATMYYFTTRISETCRFDLKDFSKPEWLPELGRYGEANIIGKGWRGSGPKPRTIPATTSEASALLDWYVRDVRPLFLVECVDAGDAMFLTRGGGRARHGGMRARFKKLIAAAGLDPTLYSPHGIRHSSTTHEVIRTDFAFGQFKTGHALAATTQIYTHIPLEFQRDTIAGLVRGSLDDEVAA